MKERDSERRKNERRTVPEEVPMRGTGTERWTWDRKRSRNRGKNRAGERKRDRTRNYVQKRNSDRKTEMG